MSDDIIYSDINFDFSETTEGDIDVLYNLDSIRQSIRNIILTPRGSRTKYQDPDFGCGVFDLLMEKMSTVTELLIKEEIETALDNYEPRVEVVEVSVDGKTENTYEILIKYKILAVDLPDELVMDLEVIK